MRKALAFHHALAKDAFVLFDPAVADGLSRHRQVGKAACEAGGILLGMRRGDHIHCTAFTEPGPRDRRTPVAFHRDPAYHQKRALEMWHRSGGLVDYLGEWHTHPQVQPTPSLVDYREWHALLKNYSGPLLFAVLGTADKLWIGLGKGSHLCQLAEVVVKKE